jgi:general secretion pathway protein J
MPARVRATAGFTLLEMLVVLVLVSLITTLLMQGLSQVLVLRSRVFAQLDGQRVTALQQHWFVSVNAALAPDQPEGEHVFAGQTGRLHGLSLMPLNGVAGMPTPVTWELEQVDNETVLRYQEGESEPWEVAHWLGDTEGFRYLDDEGTWHAQWPPGLQTTAQLPAAIQLYVAGVRGPHVWVASVRGRREPRPDTKDLLEG